MTIQVTYRRTSRLSMRIVKNGDVHVSAPIGLSRTKVEKFIEQNRDWIAEARKKTLERQKQTSEFYDKLPLDTTEQRREATRRLDELLLPMVRKNAQLMGISQPPRIYYRAMISRWGVCYPKRHQIGFSVYLLLLPDWCMEHVVVHELCHLLEPSHNARFHALMDRYFPRWREARKETRRLTKGS